VVSFEVEPQFCPIALAFGKDYEIISGRERDAAAAACPKILAQARRLA
jgi:hypothetical protein